MRSAELLEKVADQIESEPERWVQRTYVEFPARRRPKICETSFCIAGWAIAIDLLEKGEEYADGVALVDMFETGRELLGLSHMEANTMFYYGMTHRRLPYVQAAKETGEWLRSLARGEGFREAMPEWWMMDG